MTPLLAWAKGQVCVRRKDGRSGVDQLPNRRRIAVGFVKLSEDQSSAARE